MKSILIIDDDRELCQLLKEYMGNDYAISAVFNGKEGLKKALVGDYNIVVLDVMLPGIDGMTVLKELRKDSNIPVIMLTARGEEDDRVKGLELGADDYLAKPFSPRELVARINAIFRRASDSTDTIIVGDITLDTEKRLIYQNNEPVTLTEVEYSLLEKLLKESGTPVSRQLLAEQVLGRRLSYEDRSLDVHISNLRKKLGHSYENVERIRTVRGVGYLYVRYNS